MTLTERKRCDKCRAATGRIFSLFLKENPAIDIVEECISCVLRDEEEIWTKRISEIGLDVAKQEWEENRDSQLTKDIEQEMDFQELAEWEQFKEKNNQLFLPIPDDPPPLTYTERKYCNECQETTVHLKENEAEEIEEECLPCGWKTHLEDWERERERDGIETAKQRWEENRDGGLNQRVLLELTPEEKTKWDELVKETNQLFTKEIPEPKHQETQSPFAEYLPYILGGVGIVALIISVVVLFTNNRRRSNAY
jgi:hypothetical protein